MQKNNDNILHLLANPSYHKKKSNPKRQRPRRNRRHSLQDICRSQIRGRQIRSISTRTTFDAAKHKPEQE